MSDFLSNLVERALGRAPVLERRQPAIFEPAWAGEEFHLLDRGEDPLLSREEEPRGAASFPELPRRTPAPEAERPTSLPREKESVRSIVPRAVRLAEEQSIETVKTSAALVSPNESRKENVLPPEADRGTDPAPAPIRVIERVLEQEVMARPSPARPTLHAHAALLTPASSLRAACESEREILATPPSSLRPARESERKSLPTHETQTPASGAAVPPPIQITIGRLEIRASTPAPSPAPRRRIAGPRLSLDDYLQARSRGNK